MKIQDAKKAYSAQLNMLREQKRALTKRLEEGGRSGAGLQSFDRVEISRELSAVEAQYSAAQEVMEGILATEAAIHNGEAARQQGEALSEMAAELSKILEIYRRIASGGQVPQKDERKLMEYSHELYMAAKNAALLKQGEGEEYDSLWEDEEAKEDGPTASEVAAETEIAVPAPEAAAAAAAEAAPAE